MFVYRKEEGERKTEKREFQGNLIAVIQADYKDSGYISIQ